MSRVGTVGVDLVRAAPPACPAGRVARSGRWVDGPCRVGRFGVGSRRRPGRSFGGVLGTDDGDRPESLAGFQRRGPLAGPVVLRQGPGGDHRRDGGRGRRPGARDGQVPGPAPAPRGEAPRLVHLPVLRADRRPVQAPLGDDPDGRRPGPAPVGPGPPAEARQRPAPPARRGRPTAARRTGRHAPGPGRPAGGRPAPAPARPRRPGRPRRGPAPGPAARGPTAPARARPGPGRPRPKDRTGSARGPGQTWVAGRDRDKVDGKVRPKAVNRNAKRLLVYVLDVPATLDQNQVVIDLARRQRRPSGDWGPLKPWWHSPGSAAGEVRPRGPRAPRPAGGGADRLGGRRRRRRPRRPWRRPRRC